MAASVHRIKLDNKNAHLMFVITTLGVAKRSSNSRFFFESDVALMGSLEILMGEGRTAGF